MNRDALAAYIYNERARRRHNLNKGGGARTGLEHFQAKGAPFFMHDFMRADLTWQFALGVTPADDSGEAVALALSIDEIGNGTLEEAIAAVTPVLVDDFSSSLGWTLQADLAIDAGKLICTAAGSTRAGFKSLSLTPGLYRLQFDIDSVSGGNVAVELCNDASGTNGTGVNVVAAATTVTHYLRATTQTGVRFRFQAGTTAQVDNLRVERVPGYHSLQTVSTGFRPTRQADGGLKGDRLDDNLLQRLESSGSMFMAAALLGASTPSAVAAIMGGPVSTARAYIARDAAGKLCGGVGADSPTTIVGGSDIAGLKGVAMLNFAAGGQVDLEWMPKGGEMETLYSGPINGAPTAGVALRLFATNGSGAAGNYGGDTLYLAAAAQAAFTAAERRAIATDWSRRIPA